MVCGKTVEEQIAELESDASAFRKNVEHYSREAIYTEKRIAELKGKQRQDNLANPGQALWGMFWRTCSDSDGTIHDGFSVRGRFLNRQAFDFLNKVVADAKASEREAIVSYLMESGYDLSAAMIRNQK